MGQGQKVLTRVAALPGLNFRPTLTPGFEHKLEEERVKGQSRYKSSGLRGRPMRPTALFCFTL